MAILVVLGVIFGTATGTGGLVPSLGHPAMASDDGDQPYDKNALCKQVLEWGEARGLTRTLAPEFEVMQGQELRIFVSLQGRPEYDSRLAEPYLDGLYCVLDALDLDYRQTLIPADANFSVVIKRVDPNSHIRISPVSTFERRDTPRWFKVEHGSEAYEQRMHLEECWEGINTVQFFGEECFPKRKLTMISMTNQFNSPEEINSLLCSFSGFFNKDKILHRKNLITDSLIYFEYEHRLLFFSLCSWHYFVQLSNEEFSYSNHSETIDSFGGEIEVNKVNIDVTTAKWGW